MDKLPFDAPTPEETARARRRGLLAGALIGFGVFGAPALLGVVVEAARGTLDRSELPIAFGVVLATAATCALLGALFAPRALRSAAAAARREVDQWASLPVEEVLQAVCPATLLAPSGPVAGQLIVTDLRFRFLAVDGSRRRVADLGPRDRFALAQPASSGARWRGTPVASLVFDDPEPRAHPIDAGVLTERLHRWLAPSSDSTQEVDPPLAPCEPAWEERIRTAQASSDLRLVARPLRRAAARGAGAALLAIPFANGAASAIGFGCLVAALAGLEHQLLRAGRGARTLAAVGSGFLAAIVLLALVAQATSSTGAPSIQGYAAGLDQVRAILSGQDPAEGLLVMFLGGVALGLGYATAWRVGAPLAGVLLTGFAAGGLLVVDPSVWFLTPLALLVGFKLGLALVLLAVVVDVSDAWLLARLEVDRPPTWVEVFVDAFQDHWGQAHQLGPADSGGRSGAPALSTSPAP